MNQSQHIQRSPLLFPTLSGASSERSRAASAFLSLVLGVEDMAEFIRERVGMEDAVLTCCTEQNFQLPIRGSSESLDIQPDGVIEARTGAKTWKAIVHVEIGAIPLTSQTIQRLHRLAKQKKFNAVITVSNQAPTNQGQPPVKLIRRDLTKVPVHHFSWDHLFEEVQRLSHTIIDHTTGWVLDEWMRYVSDPQAPVALRSGLGEHWPQLETQLKEGTLTHSSQTALSVAEHWRKYLEHTTAYCSTKPGVEIAVMAPEKELSDLDLQCSRIAKRLVNNGSLSGRLTGGDLQGMLCIALHPVTREGAFTTDIPMLRGRKQRECMRHLARRLKSIESEPGDTIQIYWDKKGAVTAAPVAEFIKDPYCMLDRPGSHRLPKDSSPARVTYSRRVPLKGEGPCASALYLDNLNVDLRVFCAGVVRKLTD